MRMLSMPLPGRRLAELHYPDDLDATDIPWIQRYLALLAAALQPDPPGGLGLTDRLHAQALGDSIDPGPLDPESPF